MKTYSLTHLSDDTLTCGLAAAASRERMSTAELVAYIAEFDLRGLYRPAGYPSMHVYCERQLGLSSDSAYKRIQVARSARVCPRILEALVTGRLHLTGANLLAPYLTAENADELLHASAGKTKCEIQQLLADRFPCTESLPLIEACAAPPVDRRRWAEPGLCDSVMESSCQLAPAQVGRSGMKTTIAPLAPQRFELHLSFGKEMRDDLQHARNLLGHQIPSGDVAAVLHRGLKALIRELEKRKFSATDRPRPSPRPSKSAATPVSRHVPAEVQRAVWARDGGRCTFVGANRKRCPARRMLEFDHILEIARGGESTASNVRLLCKAHNQLRAEQTYGSGFMEDRRREGRAARDQAAAKRDSEQVMGCMRRLGFTADESRRAAAHACGVSNASLEARIRAALAYLVPPRRPRIESTLALSSS